MEPEALSKRPREASAGVQRFARARCTSHFRPFLQSRDRMNQIHLFYESLITEACTPQRPPRPGQENELDRLKAPLLEPMNPQSLPRNCQ